MSHIEKRIGAAAAVVAVTPPIVLGIFQVMAWKMPESLAIILVTITGVTGAVAVVVLLHAIWAWSSPIRHQYAFRWPVYRHDVPNPMQWLLDRADAQRSNVTRYLVLTDSVVMGFDRKAKRPYLRVQLYYKNLSVHNLSVTAPKGYAIYKSERLPEPIDDPCGNYDVPAGDGLTFDLPIFIPEEFRQSVCDELDSGTGEVRLLSLNALKATILIDGDTQKPRTWGLGGQRLIIRPNR